jgi:hypothetical protein
MSEAPGRQVPDSEEVKQEILEEHGEATRATRTREDHGDAAEATSATGQQEQEVSSEELENDPAQNPDNESLGTTEGA